jgi:hypothetical protein
VADGARGGGARQRSRACSIEIYTESLVLTPTGIANVYGWQRSTRTAQGSSWRSTFQCSLALSTCEPCACLRMLKLEASANPRQTRSTACCLLAASCMPGDYVCEFLYLGLCDKETAALNLIYFSKLSIYQ